MPYRLDDLVVNRVDFVNEGANSEAFIEVFKRKEQTRSMEISEILSKMKPEHASVVQEQLDALEKAREDLDAANTTISEQATKLEEANDALAKANAELENLKAPTAEPDEDEVLKSMPEGIREEFLKMRAQKEAAEEQVRKAAEEKLEAEAVAKAASMKSLPVEQSKLVSILKNCDQAVVDVLSAAAAAIDKTVLDEVGKSGKGKSDADAWAQIEAAADKIAERDSITKQKAIGIAVKENPELYREYLNGGANSCTHMRFLICVSACPQVAL